MSKKATKTSRTAAKALAVSRRTAEMARQVTSAKRLAKDAVNAAIAAACAAERARVADKSGGLPSANPAIMRGLLGDVQAAAKDAVEHAKEAMRSESADDYVSTAHFADLSLAAARRAGSLAAAASVADGKNRAASSERAVAEPKLTEGKTHASGSREHASDPLAVAIERAARYLVTYDGAIIASFEREEDAFLFESELADLDRTHNSACGKCELIDRKTGHRLGGYMLSGGQMLVFLRDDEAAKRFGKRK